MAPAKLSMGRTDQATHLRDLARRRNPLSVTIAVTSGKGGVGKSNVAVNLSICLSSQGLRVTLIDVDMGLANADLLMNLQPHYTLSHVLSGLRSVEEVITKGPCGIRFIPGASGLHQVADLTEFERQNLISQFHKLQASTDIIVLDCGAGIGRNVISFALAADRVIVVTTPEPTALTDAYAIVKTLHGAGCRARLCLFVNMVNSRADAKEAYQRIEKVAQRFLNYSIAEYGYMLQDTAVELAVQQRCPFVMRYPGSNASACIAAMASEMSRSLVGQSAVAHRNTLLRRVAGLFE